MANPYKRHKTRYPGITYRVRANGSKTYYVHAKGSQVRVTGGEREALAHQAELRSRSARGENVRPRAVSLRSLAEDWIASKNNLRPTTLHDYRADLDNTLLPRLGHLKITQVTADEIADLISLLREDRGLSGSRIDNILKPLKGTIKLALRRGIIHQNPFDLLTADERPKPDTRSHYVWSLNDIKRLIAASKALAKERDAKYDYSLLLQTAVYTGLRLGELLGLSWSDVDFKNGYIHIRHQLLRDGTLGEPKTPSAIRSVPIPRELAKTLRLHKGFASADTLVFASKHGTPLSQSNVRNRGLAPALEAAGLATAEPKITFHDLRHAYASFMAANGIDNATLAEIMGHRNSRTTQDIYTHPVNRDHNHTLIRDVVSALMGQ